MQNPVCTIFVMLMMIIIHEFGHFLFARMYNVKVKSFSCGFGPAIISKCDTNGTNWKLSALPLGGYVEFAEKKDSANEILFESISPHKKIVIAFAGPLFNYLTAFLLLAIYDQNILEPFRQISEFTCRVFNRIFSSNVFNNLQSVVSVCNTSNNETLLFYARMSVGLAFINLIPFIFVLDGGHIMVYFIEIICGIKISDSKIVKYITKGQIYFLILLSIVITARDIYKLLDDILF